MSTDLLYVVLVVTIVDPRHFRRQLTQDACAGTLVSNHLIITAASCLIHTSRDHPHPDDTKVLTGNDHSKVRYELKVNMIYIHPGFSSDEKDYQVSAEDYNIAAIVVVGNSRVKSFPKLPTKSVDFKSVLFKCKLAGYGKITALSRANFKVIALEASIVEEVECRITSVHRFCLHFYNLLPCNGDVGSPIICDGELYAIFSPNTVIYPQVCMERFTTTFVKVHSVHEWIKRIMDVPQVDMEWMSNPIYILLVCGVLLASIGGLYCLIMTWLQKYCDPMGETATETVSEGEGDGDLNTLNNYEWTKT